MKDLIIIGAYCPDREREVLLYNCVKSLEGIKKNFDILITSHSYIPEYIAEKVEYIFYDKDNDILTDLDYINQPWFSPYDGKVVHSTYVSQGYSTYLSVYRNFISALGIAKIYKYKKAHYLEYDSVINDYTDLYENSKLLDKFDNILVKKVWRDYEQNIDSIFGFFVSVNIKNLDKVFLEFDREKLLNILSTSIRKANEDITENILSKKNRKTYYKDYDQVINTDNLYTLSDTITNAQYSNWAVPYYNPDNDSIEVVARNDRYDNGMIVNFIINDENLIPFNILNKFEWQTKIVGNIEDIKSITIIVNGVQKTKIKFNPTFNEKFKKTNFIK